MVNPTSTKTKTNASTSINTNSNSNSNSNTNSSIPSSNTTTRKSFSFWGSRRFQFRADNLIDSLLDIVTWTVEKFVLVLGPLLICFAGTIIFGLSWTFFTILLPMIQRKHDNNLWILVGHVTMVAFLLIEICFNYYMCVRTPNKGPNYDKVIREMAKATHFDFPETPLEVERFRRDYEARMTIRVHRRRQREEATAAAAADEEQTRLLSATVVSESPMTETGDAKIRKNTRAKSPTVTTRPQPSPQQVRSWMFMAPDEWGYCQRSKQPKPPRSHYDHVTRTLVLCLDHYCPWMFNASTYYATCRFVSGSICLVVIPGPTTYTLTHNSLASSLYRYL